MPLSRIGLADRWLELLVLRAFGCIDFSVEAFWLTCVGRFHLRAQAMTLREVGLSSFFAEIRRGQLLSTKA